MAVITCTNRPLLGFLSLLLLMAASVHGYPVYYVDSFANGCTDHPTKGLGAHGAPVQDK
jgi:hypothetical protein